MHWALANNSRELGDFKDACAHNASALGLVEEAFGRDHLEVGRALTRMGICKRETDDLLAAPRPLLVALSRIAKTVQQSIRDFAAIVVRQPECLVQDA